MRYPNGTTTPPKVSSPYGPRPGVGVSNFHHGTDYIGFTHIHAVADGYVTYSGYMNNAAGNTIRIDHGNGVASRYMHNERNLVRNGQTVRAGDIIAVMGDTGNATGKCCHLEISIDGKSVDPDAYIRRSNNTPANNTINSKDEDMIIQIKGKAGHRNGGRYLYTNGRREFLGAHSGKGFPIISDEAQISKLFRMYPE